MSGATLDNLSTESRSFPPPEGFADQANATADWYDRADADPVRDLVCEGPRDGAGRHERIDLGERHPATVTAREVV